MPPPVLYIVMPCNNEEAGLVNTVNAVLHKLQSLKGNGMIARGITMIVWTIVDAFRGTTPGGYATLACSLWFLGGLGMMCLGVVGEYLGKLYMEAKKRPRHCLSERLE